MCGTDPFRDVSRLPLTIEGVVQGSEEGTPQGGPLSPLLANNYLDALNQELERRGLAFSRYADDCAPRAQGRLMNLNCA